MGMFRISGSSYDKTEYIYVDKPVPKPDYRNCNIVKYEQIQYNLVVYIKYEDSSQLYEGKKILLYKNTNLMDLFNQRASPLGLDPHFSPNKTYKTPFARFEPTEQGWEAAIETAKHMVKQMDENQK